LGEVEFPVSVTGVLGCLKSDYAMERIEATREVWEPRGNSCHRALELFLQLPSRDIDDGMTVAADPFVLLELAGLLQGDYADWIQPLITHERWHDLRIIASERPTCCLARKVGGTFDVAYLDPAMPPSPLRPEWVTGPARVLADLKSLGAAVVKWRHVAAREWTELAEAPADTAAVRLAGGRIEIRAAHSSTWAFLMPATGAMAATGDSIELKVSKPSTYSTAAQLGGYHTLERHGPARNWYDYGQTIWARPGQTTFSPLYSVEEMRMAWAGAWATWKARASEPGFNS
jgi:hypothetical protein